MYNGYVKDIPQSEQLKNELASVRGFLAEHPDNEYWSNRLASLEAEHQAAEVDEWLDEPCAVVGGEVMTRGEMLWVTHPTGNDDIPF